MILTFVIPSGQVTVDTQTVTDAEWLALGMTLEQLANYRAQDLEKATCETYLEHSPSSITMPEIWYLLRAFGKKLGYTFK